VNVYRDMLSFQPDTLAVLAILLSSVERQKCFYRKDLLKYFKYPFWMKIIMPCVFPLPTKGA